MTPKALDSALKAKCIYNYIYCRYNSSLIARVEVQLSLLTEIQHDIVDSSKPLSSILRKAMIFSYRLDNQEFKQWVNQELNGYPNAEAGVDELIEALPVYRKAGAHLVCNISNGHTIMSNLPINIPNLPREFTLMWFPHGIPELEKLALDNMPMLKVLLGAIEVAVLSKYVTEPQGYGCTDAWKQAPKAVVTHILETVRDRLLTFTLEIESLYPELGKTDVVPGNSASMVSDDLIRQVFNVTIAEGASMSVVGGNMANFDQKNQTVHGNQYNAVGDINFNQVATMQDYVLELEKLRSQIQATIRTGDVDEGVATDADYHVTKAVQLAKSPTPEKSSIMVHLDQLKALATKVTAFAGTVVSISKAIEILDKLI